MTANIYIVEDHLVMQQVLRMHFQRIPDLAICGMATNAEDALIAIPDTDASLVIVDVSLPDMTGIELVSRLRQLLPSLRCLMLSGHEDVVYVKRALNAGARGYLEKGKPKELAIAIKRVLAGEIYLNESVRQKLAADEEC